MNNKGFTLTEVLTVLVVISLVAIITINGSGILKEKGYFKSMNSPLDGKDLSNCLIIEATRKNSVIVSNQHDNCYEK